MLDRYSVIDDDRNRRYLLEKTQHLIGGFGKAVRDPPGNENESTGSVAMTSADLIQISSTPILVWCLWPFSVRRDLHASIPRWLPANVLSSIWHHCHGKYK